MSSSSLISVIVIFLNAERFLDEAVKSVLDQTYPHWELLLVDDGSTDASTKIAHRYAAQYPRQVRYLEHPDHQNQGTGASRDLGISHAQGEYVAFLDADDVWLPHKLAEQVAILDAQPEAGMLYGKTLYWYSWTENPEDLGRDYVWRLGVRPNTLIQPPRLLPLLLRGKADVPGPSTTLLRHSAIRDIGGFDGAFRGLYEDQAFYAKMCLRFPVYVSGACWHRYRQHPDAITAVARRMGDQIPARLFFLTWLQEYLVEQGQEDFEVWQALQAELWRLHYPVWLPPSEPLEYLMRWAKKWLLRLEERVLPAAVRRWLWSS
jgi:glycosyltransferase involved in cell wall biosynthesis